VPALSCEVCGEPFAPGDAFCEACGGELPATGPAPVAEPAAATESPAAATAPATAGATEPAPAGVACPSCGAAAEPVDGYCGACGMRLPAARDHVEVELAGAAGVSDKGKRHARNEDAMALSVAEGFMAAVVCDGVSTSIDPDIASQAAADAALAALVETHDLEAGFLAARDAVLAVDFEPRGNLSPPSCTFLAATVAGTQVSVASHGDCRAYWCAGSTVTQLTVDDSWAEEQVAAGVAPADAHAHRFAHVITRWLSRDADPEWRPRTVTFDAGGPGRLLLVSDGLWNYTIDPSQLAAAMAPAPAAPADGPLCTARRLVSFANDAGGSDNITVVVVDVVPHGVAAPDGPSGSNAPTSERLPAP
jgi:serine/threonine protein phosphatase PrpC/uncharacterized OB-fold protein